jgi:hypothetical protein
VGPIPQDGEGVLQGVVRRADTSQGLRDAAIRLTTVPAPGTRPTALNATTDDAGKFELKGLPFGSYTLSITRDGFFGPSPNGLPVSGSTVAVSIDALRKTSNVTIDLTPGGVIAGSVRDAGGAPAVNTPVSVLRLGYRKGRRALILVKTSNTDDRGAFRVAGLAPGEYNVRADVVPVAATDPRAGSAIVSFMARRSGVLGSNANLSALPDVFSPTYAPSSADPRGAASFKVRGGDEVTASISIAKSSPVRISGTVMSAVTDVTEPPFGFLLMPRDTDIDEGTASNLLNNVAVDRSGGRFEIVTARPGSYDLVAVARILVQMPGRPPGNMTSRFVSGRTPVEVRGEDITGLRIDIVSGGDLELRFSMLAGGTTQGVGYLLRSLDATDSTSLVTNTGSIVNPDGRTYVSLAMTPTYSFPSLPEGEYQFEFPVKPPNTYVSDMKQGGRSVYADGIVTVGKSAAEPVDVVFSPGGATVSGKVMSADSSFQQPVRITLVPQGARRANPLFYTRANSTADTFSLTGIAPGEYKLFAFEVLPASADENRAFMEAYESLGRTVSVQTNSSIANVELTLIRSPK